MIGSWSTAAWVALTVAGFGSGSVLSQIPINAAPTQVAIHSEPAPTLFVRNRADLSSREGYAGEHDQAQRLEASDQNGQDVNTIVLDGARRLTSDYVECKNPQLNARQVANPAKPRTTVTVTQPYPTGTKLPPGSWVLGFGGWTYKTYPTNRTPPPTKATVTVTSSGTWVLGWGGWTFVPYTTARSQATENFPPVVPAETTAVAQSTESAQPSAAPEIQQPPSDGEEHTLAAGRTYQKLTHTAITSNAGGTTQYVTWDQAQYSSWYAAEQAKASASAAAAAATKAVRKRSVETYEESVAWTTYPKAVTVTINRTRKLRSTRVTSTSKTKSRSWWEPEGGWPTLVWARPTLTVELPAPLAFPTFTRGGDDETASETERRTNGASPTVTLSGMVSGSAVVLSIPWQTASATLTTIETRTVRGAPLTVTSTAIYTTAVNPPAVTSTVTSILTSKDTMTFTYFYGNVPVTSKVTQTQIDKSTVVSVYSPVIVSPKPTSNLAGDEVTPSAFTVVVVQTTDIGGERSLITQLQGGPTALAASDLGQFTGLPEAWGSQIIALSSRPRKTRSYNPTETRPPTFAPMTGQLTTFRTSPRSSRTEVAPLPVVTYTSLDGYTPLYEAPNAQPTFEFPPPAPSPPPSADEDDNPTPQETIQTLPIMTQESFAAWTSTTRWTSTTKWTNTPKPKATLDPVALQQGLQALGQLLGNLGEEVAQSGSTPLDTILGGLDDDTRVIE